MTECIIVSGLLLCAIGMLIGSVSAIMLIQTMLHGDIVFSTRDALTVMISCLGVVVGMCATATIVGVYIIPQLPCIQVV